METAQQYQPEVWPVSKNTIYAARSAVSCGLEYARARLANHNGTSEKNRRLTEIIARDMRQMEAALKELHECGPG